MFKQKVRASLPAVVLACVVLAGCSANPVTGEKELVLFSTQFEIETGRTNYGPAQQAEGGRYAADPELSGYVASVGHRVATVSDQRLPYEFVVLNNGVPNAWALPGGKIAVNRGLLMEMENEAELAAVLSHEVVHAAARHGAQAMNRGLLFELAVLAAELGVSERERFGQVVGAGVVAFGLINQGYSREAERVADYHGMRYLHAAGYDTTAAVTLQEKFLRLSRGRNEGWLLGLFASHPPSVERVESNRAALAQFPPGGDSGRERYQARIAGLIAAKPAYDAGDEARQLLTARPAQSLRRIEEAIAREPREASFHGIKGQALARLGRLREAVDAYGAATALGPAYWEHYLGRGLAHDALGNGALAQSDLRRSLALLPTGLGNLALGVLALEGGHRPEAKRLFDAAREAEGAVGAAAEREYLFLDIPDAPWRFVSAEPFFEDGRVVVEVANRSPYPLGQIVIRLDAEFNGQPIRRFLRQERLRSGQRAVLDGGVRYREEDELTVQTHVDRVQPVVRRAAGERPFPPYP